MTNSLVEPPAGGAHSGGAIACLVAAVVAGGALVPVAPLGAQVGVVIHGRVEDAYTRAPIAGARVLSADSSSAILTDSIGQFALLVDEGLPRAVHVEQFGYEAQRFDLGDEAPARISVLLLEPEPIELEAIHVVEESAVTELLRDLRGRRNAYLGSVMALDKPRLERYSGASAWDFVLMRAPRIFECSSALSGLCMPGRDRTFRDPYPEVAVLICVDGRESWGATSELSTLDMASVALVEVYSLGRGGIRFYTASYLANSARRGRNIATPLWFGC